MKRGSLIKYLARRLVERSRDLDWQARATLYGTALKELARYINSGTPEFERWSMDLARAVVRGFGNPPVTCAPQFVIWAASSDPQHRMAADDWLRSRPNEVVLERYDGERLVIWPGQKLH